MKYSSLIIFAHLLVPGLTYAQVQNDPKTVDTCSIELDGGSKLINSVDDLVNLNEPLFGFTPSASSSSNGTSQPTGQPPQPVPPNLPEPPSPNGLGICDTYINNDASPGEAAGVTYTAVCVGFESETCKPVHIVSDESQRPRSCWSHSQGYATKDFYRYEERQTWASDQWTSGGVQHCEPKMTKKTILVRDYVAACFDCECTLPDGGTATFPWEYRGIYEFTSYFKQFENWYYGINLNGFDFYPDERGYLQSACSEGFTRRFVGHCGGDYESADDLFETTPFGTSCN